MMRARRILAYRKMAVRLMPDPLTEMRPGLRLLIVAWAYNRADMLAERQANRVMLRGRQKHAKARAAAYGSVIEHDRDVAGARLELFHDMTTGGYVQIEKESA